jgi:hypothetical protein
MCGCEGSFVCSRCAGTPFDPRYMDDEPAELSLEQFEDLMVERVPIIMLGEEG